MMKGLSRFLAAALLCLSLPVVAAENVKLRSGFHPGYARIVIDWPSHQQAVASLSDERLVVRVPAGNSFDLSALQQGIRGYTGPVRLSADSRTLEFPLLGDFELSQQRVANKTVLDLLLPSRESQEVKETRVSPPLEPLWTARSVQEAEARSAVSAAAGPTVPVTGQGQATAKEQSLDKRKVAGSSRGDSLPEVGFRFAQHDDHDRLVFDWTESVKASIGPSPASGFRVTFNKPARIRLSSLGQRPMTFVKAGAQKTERPASVDFDLEGNYQTKLFKVGKKVVVDVSRRASTPLAEAAPSPRNRAGNRPDKAGSTDSSKKDKQKQDASTEKTLEVFPDKTASLPGETNNGLSGNRKALDLENVSRQSAGDVAVAQKQETSRQGAPISLRDFDRQRLEEETVRSRRTQGRARPGALTPISAVEQDFVKRIKPDSDKDLIPIPGRAANLLPPLIVNFNWQDDVRAAAYQRGGSLWLVFDRQGPAYLERVLQQLLPEVEAIEVVPVSGATVIRMDLPATHIPRLSRPPAEENDATKSKGQVDKVLSQEGKQGNRTSEQALTETADERQAQGADINPNSWILDIRRRTPLPQEAILSQVIEENGEKRVRFTARSLQRLFSIPDERLGDRVVVAPVGQPNLGILHHDRYVQFEALPSYQGVVLYPRSEGLAVGINNKGVLVRSKDELLVSGPSARKSLGAGSADFPSRNPLMDLEAARRGPAKHYEINRRILRKELSSLTGKDQDLARFELAQFYFAHGRMNEALGMLDILESENSRLIQDPLAQLIKGAAHFSNEQYDEAYRVLSTPLMVGEKETVLWHSALAAAAHDWKPAASGFQQSQELIASLPGNLRNQFYFMAIESYLHTGDDLHIGAVFRELQKAMGTMTAYETGQYDYLLASYRLFKGEEEASVEALRDLRYSRHRPTSARARYSLLQLALNKGEISPEGAIDELERLRFAWRGDSFEFILLNKLAELYAQEGDYRRSLESLRQAAAHFAFSERADHSAGRMAEIFESMYLEDGGRRIPPLTAVALYEEFKELTPAGAKGDTMITRLADRLVDVDLLGQAFKLLDYQVNNRLVGAERQRVGSRLALLGILDDRPQDALDALDRTESNPESEAVPESLVLRRRHLRAKALADLGHSDEALELLRGDSSLDGLRLSVDILWKERRWPEATQQLGLLVPSTPPVGRAMKEGEAQMVLNLAISQSLSSDYRGLALLASIYQDAMKETQQAKVFDLLTRNSDLDADLSIAEQLAEVAEFEAFADQFRKQTDQSAVSQ